MKRGAVQTRTTASGLNHVVWCTEPGCTFVYSASVKVDAAYQAKYHRNQHRTKGGAL